MKKIFSFLAAVLFAGSMMATEVTINPATMDSVVNAEVSAVIDGVSVSVTNGTVAPTLSQIRIFKNQTLTLSVAEGNITSIVFTCAAEGTTKWGPGCFGTGAPEGYSYEGATGTWTGSATEVSFTTIDNQVRATSIVVTVETEAAEAPIWKVTEETSVEAGATHLDNDLLTISAPYASTLKNNSYTYGEEAFERALQVRVDAFPTAEDVIGTEKEGSTPLIVTAKADANITIYYCRQAVDKAVAENDSKDIRIVDQAAPTTFMTGTFALSAFTSTDSTYALCTKVIALEAGHIYTICAKGTTVQLSGIGYEEPAPVLPQVGIGASFNEWAWADNLLTPAADNLSASMTVALEAGSYELKVVSDGNWLTKYGEGGLYALHREWPTAPEVNVVNVADNNMSLTADVAGDYTFTWTYADSTLAITFPEVGPQNLGEKTIAEFLELKNTKDTCVLTGIVSNIVNTTYGNFDLTDATGTVYVYGLLTAAGESQQFASLNVAENDTLTVKAIYNEYKGNAQAKNAIFVEVKKSSAPVVELVNLGAKTIAEFLELKNMKDTCILTAVVDSIKNTTYGNLYMSDATGQVYVYGVLNAAGESKKFADLNVAAGDTLTLKAIYSEYNGAPQVKNGIFVEVKKAAVVTDAVDVTMTDGLRWTDAVADEGWWQIYGEDENFFITLSNAGSVTAAAGTYSAADLDAGYSWLVDMTNTADTISFVSGEFTVAVSDAGVATLVGALVGNDGKTYNLNLTFTPPTATTEVDVTINPATRVEDYEAYGLFAVYGEDANGVYVQLAYWGDALEGTYDEMDLDQQYVGSFVYVGEVAIEIYSADFTVAANGTGYTLSGSLLCFNNTKYNITLTIPAGEGIEDVEAVKKAVKMIENGQVVIEKNGVKYSVSGARL